jgi:hypothetical protein
VDSGWGASPTEIVADCSMAGKSKSDIISLILSFFILYAYLLW